MINSKPSPRSRRIPILLGVAGSFLAATASVLAQCPQIDFEDRAVGTRITTQYTGVTFFTLVTEQLAILPAIFTTQRVDGGLTYNTSSPTRGLNLGEGFDVIVPVGGFFFDRPQTSVEFTLGENAGTYNVRTYSDAAGTTLTGTRIITLGSFGTVAPGTVRLVRLTGTAAVPIRRVEITGNGGFKRITIDDLGYDQDFTPPSVEINQPPETTCVCPTGSISVTGYTYEPDGLYVGDSLDVMRVNAPAGTAWTTIGSFTGGPVNPPGGTLYVLSAASVLAALPGGGEYRVRVLAHNGCGYTNYDETRIYIDNVAPSLSIASPGAGQIVGGALCITGTVDDRCGVSYTLAFKPVGGSQVSLGPPVSGSVINGTLGTWNTRTGAFAVPDGSYDVLVAATDPCSNISTAVRRVVVDNTPPVAFIATPAACSRVAGLVTITGTVTDANLAGWTLQYAGGPGSGWTTIASGASNIVNGVLANWDTSSLPPCAYVLRLVATDLASVNCGGGSGPFCSSGNTTEWVRLIDVGTTGTCLADIVSIGGLPPPDGLVTGDDFNAFINAFAAGCP